MLIGKGTIIICLIIVGFIFVLFSILYLFLYWKKLKSEMDLKEARGEPVDIPIKKKFFKDFTYVLSDKFYEIPGFAFIGLTLLIAILSIINSTEVSKIKVKFPDINVIAKKYKFQKKDEIKLILNLKSGMTPKNPKIEFIPIFYVHDKEKGFAIIPKDPEDFTNSETREIDFTKDKYEIPSLLIYICDQEKYSNVCNKIKSKEAILSGFRYKIYGKLGISKEILIDENTAFVK